MENKKSAAFSIQELNAFDVRLTESSPETLWVSTQLSGESHVQTKEIMINNHSFLGDNEVLNEWFDEWSELWGLPAQPRLKLGWFPSSILLEGRQEPVFKALIADPQGLFVIDPVDRVVDINGMANLLAFPFGEGQFIRWSRLENTQTRAFLKKLFPHLVFEAHTINKWKLALLSYDENPVL